MGDKAVGEEKTHAGVLIAERFVDLVDALLMYISGPHEDMSVVTIDNLVTLSSFLADKKFVLPIVQRHLVVGTSVKKTL